jgi:ABC-type glycerol-3-phosphate transport system permease component
MIVPIVFIIFGATHESGWMFSIPFDYSLGSYLLNNVDNLISESTFYSSILNSLVVGTVTALLSVIVIGLASYGFSVFDFYGRKIMIIVAILLISVPQQSSLIGQLTIINKLGMYSTLYGLIIPFIINIRVFLLLNSNLENIDRLSLDAARVDGANEFQIMNLIAFPAVKDKLVLAYFLIFIASWNNFLIPMLITFDSSTQTLPILISSLADPLRYDTGKVFVSLLIKIVPVVILYSIINKELFLIEDVSRR